MVDPITVIVVLVIGILVGVTFANVMPDKESAEAAAPSRVLIGYIDGHEVYAEVKPHQIFVPLEGGPPERLIERARALIGRPGEEPAPLLPLAAE